MTKGMTATVGELELGLRILMVCNDADIGGAERMLATFASAKSKPDVVALAVLMGRGSLSDELESRFDEVFYLDFERSSRNVLSMVRALHSIIRRFRPDIISSHLFQADLITSLVRTKVPKVSTIHTQALGPDDHISSRVIAWSMRFLSRSFSAMIPASHSEDMRRFIKKLKLKHVVAPISNAATVPRSIAYDPSRHTFLMLARNHPVKGYARALEAFSSIARQAPDWEFVAYGPNVSLEDASMSEIVETSGASDLLRAGRVKLMGPTSDPSHALQNAGALVIASTYGEAFPMVGAEAAGLGVPVITTDLGSCAEFADDPRFLVPPNNSLALATSMLTFVNLTDSERQELSDQARSRALSRYQPAQMYRSYRALFSGILAQRANPSS